MYEQVQERLKKGPRTWLVPGAAGSIGSHLIESLLKQADIGKANRLLGYRPVQPASDEGLASALDWYAAKVAPRRSVRHEIQRSEVALSGS